MMNAFVLFVVSACAGALGSMVGLGGGFILVPVLRLAFGFAPAEAAGTSLLLIVASSASATVTYFLQRRVHVRIGVLIAIGGLPGSILGGFASQHISAPVFDIVLAVMLIAVAGDMAWNAGKRMRGRPEHEHVRALKGMSYRAALLMGVVVGVFSSLFGVGGGVVMVPAMLYFSELPIHAISATSQFGILLTSPVGLAFHAVARDIDVHDVVPLFAGGLIGGPIGARLSLKLKSPQLVFAVACALLIVAASLIWRHLR
jgi:uncharacterized membrane protein YfcA